MLGCVKKTFSGLTLVWSGYHLLWGQYSSHPDQTKVRPKKDFLDKPYCTCTPLDHWPWTKRYRFCVWIQNVIVSMWLPIFEDVPAIQPCYSQQHSVKYHSPHLRLSGSLIDIFYLWLQRQPNAISFKYWQSHYQILF